MRSPLRTIGFRGTRNWLFVVAIALLTFAGFATGPAAHAQGPCDVFASHGTPCVASFSTVRAMSSSYSGPLYQVTRASDNTTQNIAPGAGGFAAASVQDTFCANTSCTITKIYDQTANHNDLTIAPPGGNARGSGPNGYDLPSLATASPAMAGGHKVYGVYIAPGNGYRNDSARQIPTGSAPEGVYMVASGMTEVLHNTAATCCFDFGNAEVDNDDDGAGTMDAITLMCFTNPSGPANAPCQPTVAMDLENGDFNFQTTNANKQFVTAAGWNDGVNSFETYSGDATQGSLSTSAPVSLTIPKSITGTGVYTPMNKKGGIVLGIGGDNSIRSAGEFYEGAMTQGAPSTATLNAIQANVVGAAYQSALTAFTDGRTYSFTNQASQMSLDNDCNGCSSTATTGVEVDEDATDGLNRQAWTLHAQGNGFFTMVSVQSGMCLDDPWGNANPSRDLPQKQGDSTMLWQQPCNGATPQNWRFIPQSNGTYVIQNQAATIGNGNLMVVDVYYGMAQNGLQMWLDTPNGLSPQNWTATTH